jgi:hypothetical protein
MASGAAGLSTSRRLRGSRRSALWLLLSIPVGLGVAMIVGTSASGAEFAAEAAVFPTHQYLDDQPGTTFTLTVHNTGTTTSIGAVEIRRPSQTSNNWAVISCPMAPAGWTTQATSTMCRYRSADGIADDIPAGATSSAFQMRASTLPGTQNRVGAFEVVVSKRDQFDAPSTIVAVSAAEMAPGLTTTVHSFQVLDAVVANAPATPGSACPAPDKDALTGQTVTMVVCGRNRTTVALTPVAAYSSLGGTFLQSAGTFSSGVIAPTGPTGASIVLGNWQSAHVTSSSGTGKTVVAVIGSAVNRTSPSTTLTGYEAINRPPVANDDTGTTNENTAAVINVLANDSDPDGDAITVGSVDTTGTAGTVTNNGTNVTYDPNGAFEELGVGETAIDTFSYTANDTHGSGDTATVTITVTGVNDPPAATDDTTSASEDGPAVVVNVLANDTDVESDALVVSAVDNTGTTGSATVTNGGANVTYDPNGAFEGLAAGETAIDSFGYTVSDGHGGTDTATVTVTVTGVNDAPSAVDDTATASEDGPGVGIDVLANDSDPDASDALTVSAVDTTGTAGSVTNNGSDVSYDPNGAFDSLAFGETAVDSFSYTVSDGHGGTDTATVNVTVTGVNDPPTAVDDDANVGEDGPGVNVDVLANDSDPDASDALTVSAVDTTGTAGSVTNNGTDVSYDPNGAFDSLGAGDTAIDTFSYTVNDGHGGTDTATVTVTVTGANDAPSATDDSFTGAVGNTKLAVGVTVTGEPVVNVTGNLLDNDTDPDGGGALTTSLVSSTAGAAVTVNGDGSFTYVSPPGFEGTDTFVYSVSDGGASDTASVSVGVSDVVWYVDNSQPAGNGTSISPYSSLASLQGADADDPGDYLFVYRGSGSYGGGIALEASQKLWGEPFGLVVGASTLVPASGGANPVVTNASGAGITLASNADVQRVDVATTSGAGISATGVGTATVGANTSVTGAAGDAVAVSGGSGTLSIGSSITNTAGRSVHVTNRTGGTVTLSGAVNDTGTGVNIASNSGATVTLSGTLTLSTGTSTALGVSGGGTVNVTGTANTATTTTATAVSVQGTTIGASGVHFRSVSSSGAATGIVVDGTGSSGGLVVTGTGTSGSGGTIASSTGDGIRLHDTSDTSLSWMNVNGSASTAGATCTLVSAADCASGIDMVGASSVTIDHVSVNGSGQQGISGHDVNGLTVTNSVVDNAGNGNDEFGMLLSRLSGTVLIQDTLIDQSEEGAIRLYNDQGTLNMTVRRVTMSNNDTATGEDGFQLEVANTGTSTVLVDDSTFDELDRDGIDALVRGTATLNLTVKDSDITDDEGGGIIANAANTATLRTTIQNNTITNLTATGINLIGTVNSTVNAIVTGNTITNPTPPSAQNGFGIRLSQEEDGDFTAKVENNTTAGTGFGGIKVLSRLGNLNSSPGTSAGDTGTMHAMVRNNVVGVPLNADFGIEVSAITAENSLCTVYTGNVATGNTAAGVRARQASTAVVRVEGLAAGAQTAATTATYLNANNTSVTAATAAGNFTGVAAGTCRTAATTPQP